MRWLRCVRIDTSRTSWGSSMIGTVYFGHDPQNDNERTIYWMTKGQRYQCSFPTSCRYLGLDAEDVDRSKIHFDTPLSADQVTFMYPRDRVGDVGKVTGFYTYYSVLNRLFRKTLTPRDGNPSDISAHVVGAYQRHQR
jgi:hypothetical protein